MDFITVAATWGGTVRRSSVTSRGSSVRIRTRMLWALGPVCGGWPASISYSTQPKL
jgi:hypothetical protein